MLENFSISASAWHIWSFEQWHRRRFPDNDLSSRVSSCESSRPNSETLNGLQNLALGNSLCLQPLPMYSSPFIRRRTLSKCSLVGMMRG